MSRYSTSTKARASTTARNPSPIAVTIQPREKTLTDQEIDAVAAKIVAEVAKKTGGTLRG